MNVSRTTTIARSFSLHLVLLAMVVAAIAAFALARGGGPAYAATFTVNAADDTDDGACDAAHCSLREAILAANGSAGMDLITFAIGAGQVTIAPASALPAISQAAIVDGTSQPGYAGSPLVRLNGASAGAADGLVLTGGNSTVRGLSITSFGGSGVRIDGAMSNYVIGNWIGVDPSGAGAGNAGDGVVIGSSFDNTIGGTSAADRNVISGNGGNGVSITSGFVNRLRGNYIGTDPAGAAAMPNGAAGVRIAADNNLVGGTPAGARNVISGNAGDGVAIVGAQTTQNGIEGNYIGLAADGESPLGNGANGVWLDNSIGHNGVGGASAGAGNRIAHNARNGVFVYSGTGHPVLTNAIYANGGLGIDLFDAPGSWGVVTPNDPGDGDTGANRLQNYPVLTSALPSGGGVTVEGSLDSVPNAQFRLEFFVNGDCAGSNGEGESYIGAADVTTDASGIAAFSVSLSGSVAEGSWVTATARDAQSNTSEFSPCQYAGVLPTPTATPTATATATSTPTHTPVPPTATHTATAVPPTATRTATSVPPTATRTAAPAPPTATPTVPAPTSTPGKTPRGICGASDLDGDGRVTGRDVAALVHALHKGRQEARYDVNGDGRVNGTDLVLSLKCAASDAKPPKEKPPHDGKKPK